jgi:hypothetical protein
MLCSGQTAAQGRGRLGGRNSIGNLSSLGHLELASLPRLVGQPLRYRQGELP